MEACRILLICKRPLFAEGLTRLLAGEAVEVVATVTGWEQAQELIARHRPQAIIVEHEGDQAPLPAVAAETSRVIYLTLAADEMVVHEQRRVAPVTAADLLGALRASPVPAQAGASSAGKAGKAKKRKTKN